MHALQAEPLLGVYLDLRCICKAGDVYKHEVPAKTDTAQVFAIALSVTELYAIESFRIILHFLAVLVLGYLLSLITDYSETQ